MVGAQSGQRPAQSIALPGQMARFVLARGIDVQTIDEVGKPPPSPIPAATHDDAVEPGIEGGLISQVAPALPRPNRRVVDRVLGL